MKKYLIFFSSLVIVSALLLGICSGVLHSRRDDVTVTCEVLYGDAEESAGMEIALLSTLNNHLRWKMAFDPSRHEECVTEFEFTPYSFPYEPRFMEARFYISSMSSNVSMSGNIDFEEEHDDPYLQPLMVIWKDVASRCPNGAEEYSETVSIADYYEYYPLYPEFSGGDEEIYITETEKAREELNEIFKIPVPEDHLLEVIVSKDQAGGVYHVDSRGLNYGRGYEISSSGIITKDAVWFTFYVTNSEDGSIVEIPGLEKGIYRMPVREREKSKGGYTADVLNTTLVYSSEKYIFGLTGGDENTLLFISADDDRKNASLGVMDTGSSLVTQMVPFAWENAAFGIMEKGDHLFVTTDDQGFAVFSKENGYYTLEMCSEKMTGQAMMTDYYYEIDTAYKDGRLGLISLIYRYGNEAACTLQVFDKNGLLYEGKYATDLPSYLEKGSIGFVSE